MSVGFLVRVKDLRRSEALYADVFADNLDVGGKAERETTGGERGRLDPSWLQVWGHGGRDPVATAWAVSVGYLEGLLARLRWTDEAQRACDIYNDLSRRLEPFFIQERIRESVRPPTLRDAQLEADRVAALRDHRG